MTTTYTSEYQRFLARLKAARKESGLTQAKVAKMLGHPQSFVAKCESGERRVDVIELQAFARIYKKRVTDFVEES